MPNSSRVHDGALILKVLSVSRQTERIASLNSGYQYQINIEYQGETLVSKLTNGCYSQVVIWNSVSSNFNSQTLTIKLVSCDANRKLSNVTFSNGTE